MVFLPSSAFFAYALLALAAGRFDGSPVHTSRCEHERWRWGLASRMVGDQH
jgi:hypothetical protein